MQQPETRYVSLGRERVAYQVFGEGDQGLLFLLPVWLSVDALWENVGHLRIWRLASDSFRVVLLDHRGFGMSDAIPESRLADPEVCVEDALTVLDEVGIDRVCVVGEGYGAFNAVTLAVQHPDRVDKLALMNASAMGLGCEHGWSTEEASEISELVRERWGSGRMMQLAPLFSDDLSFLARFERMGARPAAAAAAWRNVASIDIRSLLADIAAPTLVAHSRSSAADDSGPARYLADHIPGARYFEAESSTFYWGGGIVEEIYSFLGADRAGHRGLATVLFTDVVDSTRSVVATGDREWRQTLDFLDDLVAARVTRAGGRTVKQTGDGHLVEFDHPSDAVASALEICRDAPTLGVRVRAGVHTGEVERRDGGDLGGLSVHIAARVAAVAGPGEVVISRTVADLLGSADYELRDRGDHELKGVPGRWQLFTVAD
jgi:class 3 adenylate cyclase/alpha-beta hydrolase superfamily lysophospholipase